MSDDTFDPSPKPITPFGNDKRMDSGFEDGASSTAPPSREGTSRYQVPTGTGLTCGDKTELPVTPVIDVPSDRSSGSGRSLCICSKVHCGAGEHGPYLPQDLRCIFPLSSEELGALRLPLEIGDHIDLVSLHTALGIEDPKTQFLQHCPTTAAAGSHYCTSCDPRTSMKGGSLGNFAGVLTGNQKTFKKWVLHRMKGDFPIYHSHTGENLRESGTETQS